MAPGHQLCQRELGLLSTRERAGVLASDVAREAEHPKQGAEQALIGVRLVAHVGEHRHASANALVLLSVVPERYVVPEPELAGVGLGFAGEDAQQARLP